MFEEAAKTLHEEGLAITMGTIDATVAKDLASEYELKGYPTLKLFKYGKFQEDYSGKRETAEFVEVLGGSMEESKAKAATPEMLAEHKPWKELYKDAPVQYLGKDNFKSSMTAKSLTMVMFYSPGHTSSEETRRHFYDAAGVFEHDPNGWSARRSVWSASTPVQP